MPAQIDPRLIHRIMKKKMQIKGMNMQEIKPSPRELPHKCFFLAFGHENEKPQSILHPTAPRVRLVTLAPRELIHRPNPFFRKPDSGNQMGTILSKIIELTINLRQLCAHSSQRISTLR